MQSLHKWFYILISLTLFCGGSATAQQLPSALEMLKNVEHTMEGVTDYTVDLQAEVDMERMRIPKMLAKMYFKRPNKIHFESSSFAMLPREGIALDPKVLRENYDASFLATEQFETQKVYKIQLAAKGVRTRLRQLFIWIDPYNWTIVKMETIPYQGRVLTVTFTHEMQEGKYWLPQTMHASFEASGRDTAGSRSDSGFSPTPQWDEMQRPPRSGSIHVTYSNYTINLGLSDELFERREQRWKE